MIVNLDEGKGRLRSQPSVLETSGEMLRTLPRDGLEGRSAEGVARKAVFWASDSDLGKTDSDWAT
jgi:hypothetical protein